MKRQYMKVKIRRNIGRDVKIEAEQIDGKVYSFRFGWEIDENGLYPGEDAWIADDLQYPVNAPIWIASGDLERA